MQLLDAAIALMVTLGALATTVTITIEIFVRFFGLRKRDQINLFSKIYSKSFDKRFAVGVKKSGFLEEVLVNPLQADRLKHKHEFDDPNRKATMWDSWFDRAGHVYDNVSTEHVLRRIASLPGVLEVPKARLIQKFQEFNREYDELCAAASTQFRDNRRMWSVITGIVLAVGMNVNALRIYEAYMEDPTLTAAIIAEMDGLREASENAEQKLQATLDALEAGSAKSGEDDAQARKNAEELNQRLDDLNAQLSGLQARGIPIGWEYPPHKQLYDWASGFFGGEDEPENVTLQKVTAATDRKPSADHRLTKSSLVGSILAMLGTGLLIGMGAPFWFDLAKRLAEVRSMFSGRGTTASMHDGATPPSQAPESSKDPALPLIERVVDDAIASAVESLPRKLLVEKREL